MKKQTIIKYVKLAAVIIAVVVSMHLISLLHKTYSDKTVRYGYIDKTGTIVIAPSFTLADSFSEGLAAVRVVGGGRRIKYIDRAGQIIIDSQEGVFHSADNMIPFFPLFTFHEGFRRIQTSNNKFGFIGKSGEIIIEPIFDRVHSFSEGLAAVRIQEQWGYINSVGEVVIKPRFENFPGSFSQGLAHVILDNKFGYINKQGTIVIDPRFESAYPFSEGLAPVEVDGKWGYIDKNGKFVIAPKFDDWLGFFKEGRTIVAIDSKWQVIDKTGRIMVEAGKYSYCRESGFSEGLSVVKNLSDLYGFINTEGKLVIEFQFERAYPFSEGLAAVKINRKWGYINKSGEFVIKPQFEFAHDFSEGLAAVGVRVSD